MVLFCALLLRSFGKLDKASERGARGTSIYISRRRPEARIDHLRLIPEHLVALSRKRNSYRDCDRKAHDK